MSPAVLGIDEIDRKYQLVQKLGEGGMGAVYKVRHRLLEEFRVIKMIRSELKDNQDLQARFLREAKVATRLQHPNIAHLADFSITDDGTAYIVMEFVDGTNLAEVLKSQGPLSVEAAVAVTSESLRALSYLHRKQIVHRDISPDNIMLIPDRERSARVKLIDLGIAKSLESTQAGLTQTGLFIGKIRYGSPEQLSGNPDGQVEARSDLYSMGLVLYELLTGESAVTGTDEASIMAGHLFHPPRSFDETDPDRKVPPELRQVVLKALEKRVDARYASADDFRVALTSIGSDRPEVEEEDDDEPSTVILDRPLAVPDPTSAAAPDRTRLVGTPGRGGLGARFRRWRWHLGGLAVAIAVAALALGPLDLPGRFASPTDRAPTAAGAEGTSAALSALDFGEYHALVIGNNRYQELPSLETATADAEEVGALLEARYGFNVRVLTDATRYEMITALTEVAAEMTARDNLLIYYAGHGWLDEQNQSGYWQPVDAERSNTANWVSTKYEVSAVLAPVPAKRVLVVADSCYSGSLVDEVVTRPEESSVSGDRLEEVQRLLERRTRLALSSGGLSPVLDVGDGRHSVFARALIDLLESNDEVIEISSIFTRLRDGVSEGAARLGVEQVPRLAPIPQSGDEGGDFFFVPRQAVGQDAAG